MRRTPFILAIFLSNFAKEVCFFLPEEPTFVAVYIDSPKPLLAKVLICSRILSS